ncbi:pantoate kinase [Thermogladius sp. 4427co]|uniref:pantoate kinase n=1 Tax=Thermogladius sp. 4427co TaxID=3450718 RepID=UPI003F78EB1A
MAGSSSPISTEGSSPSKEETFSSNKIIVYVPLHVSGFWKPALTGDPLRSGSVGAGIALDLYTRAVGRLGDCSIFLNGVRVMEEHSSLICAREGVNVVLKTESPVGLGKGFAVSGALSLSQSIASSLLSKGVIGEASSWSAHIAEVVNGTGLGDVIAQFYGGFVIRIKPGPPGIGSVISIKSFKPSLIVAELPGSESTKAMLSRVDSKTYSTAEESLRRVHENPSLEVFFEEANRFTRRIFDYSAADEIVRGARGVIGFYVKKKAFIAWVEDEWAMDLLEALSSRGLKAFKTTISSRGAWYVHTAEPS